jgi:peptidyl-tRNA hydrolase
MGDPKKAVEAVRAMEQMKELRMQQNLRIWTKVSRSNFRELLKIVVKVLHINKFEKLHKRLRKVVKLQVSSLV